MEYKKVKNFENYIIFENGSVLNTKTGKDIKEFLNKHNNQYYIRLTNNGKNSTFTLSRLVYETYYDEKLTTREIISFKDGNKTNFHYKNLVKVKRIDMFKSNEEIILDTSKEWKKIENYDDYYISNYGDFFSIKVHKFMKPVDYNSYLIIKLKNNDNIRNTFYVHTLVYDLFRVKKEKKDDKHYIIHIDGNKKNNYINNLSECVKSWTTYKYVEDKEKVIYQFSMDKKFIKEWINISEIINSFTNYNNNYILDCCRNKHKTTYGFIWKFDHNIEDYNTNTGYSKKIYQIKLKNDENDDEDDDIIIREFNSIREAYKELNKNYGNNIRLACIGKRKSAFGYKWKFA